MDWRYLVLVFHGLGFASSASVSKNLICSYCDEEVLKTKYTQQQFINCELTTFACGCATSSCQFTGKFYVQICNASKYHFENDMDQWLAECRRIGCKNIQASVAGDQTWYIISHSLLFPGLAHTANSTGLEIYVPAKTTPEEYCGLLGDYELASSTPGQLTIPKKGRKRAVRSPVTPDQLTATKKGRKSHQKSPVTPGQLTATKNGRKNNKKSPVISGQLATTKKGRKTNVKSPGGPGQLGLKKIRRKTGHSRAVDNLKNDYFILRRTSNRLAGWEQLNKTENQRCDIVRRNIKTFRYCWAEDENKPRNIDTTTERGWVREVIQQWEKCGGIQFVEEPTCRSGPDFVNVTVGNYWPCVGVDVDMKSCKINGFTMFLDFYTFGQTAGYRDTEKQRKSNIQMYALHEFGHFLGFEHEHNRNDRGDRKCRDPVDKEAVGPNAVRGNYHISSAYDPDSIMNYCTPHGHYKPWLSRLDKEAVALAYGGGNKAECDAVTKPWTWGPDDGLDESRLRELQNDLNDCDDLESQEYCEARNASCQDENVRKSCALTCNYCQGCVDILAKADCEDRVARKESCQDETMKRYCPNTCKRCCRDRKKKTECQDLMGSCMDPVMKDLCQKTCKRCSTLKYSEQ